jgi:acyl-CoA thioester hydrolase
MTLPRTLPESGALQEGKFTYRSEVYFDELDPLKMLHNARYAVHVERATTALYYFAGFRWELDVERNPDQFHAVRDYHIEFRAPLMGQGAMTITLGLQHLGETSCVYGFLCEGAGGEIHACGTRTIVKLDPNTSRPTAWTERFRTSHLALGPLALGT